MIRTNESNTRNNPVGLAEAEHITETSLAEEIGLYLKDAFDAEIGYRDNTVTIAFPKGQIFTLTVTENK